MSRNVSDVLRIMRLAIGRRNENDTDSNDATLLGYINDFASLSMSDDIRLFEQWGTISFEIDETNTTGVYEFPSNDTAANFTNTSIEALVSLKDPEGSSLSWNQLEIYQDPGRFFGYWGINNTDVLIAGFPTEMLYYGNEFTFRTIPDTTYLVNIYGYKQNPDFSPEGNPELPFDYWMRYLAYGAALNYASDYRLEGSDLARIKAGFTRERSLLANRTYDQVKTQRALPRF